MTDAPFDSPAIVIKDSQKPSFQTGLFACKNPNPYKSTQETVCLNVGEFTGPLWGTAYAPFMGTVIGDIYTIKVDNTYVKWSEDGIINQRVPLYVQEGQNNYDVEIIDMAGNKTTDLYTISWGDKYQESQDNLYDQINDLESRLEELE